MSKRGSGAPRHPRNPVAKAVRTPAFKQQVVPDKRWKQTLKQTLKQVDANTKAGAVDTEAGKEADNAENTNKD
jgi:hypothetical protein